MESNPVIPIILCGGSGSRLWPLSRKSFPKQYLKLNSSDKNSLLQNTYKRISKVKNLNINELKANLINKKKNELFNLYSKSLLSKLRNTSLIQYN